MRSRFGPHPVFGSFVVFLSTFLLTGSRLVSQAQTTPAQTVDVIVHLNLVGKTLNQNGVPTLLWQVDLTSLPDVTTADAEVKQRVLAALQSMKADAAAANHPWVVRFGDRFDFFGKLTTALGQPVPIISPPGFARTPSAEGVQFSGDWKFKYKLKSMGSLSIAITTLKAAAEPQSAVTLQCGGANGTPGDKPACTVADVATRFDVGSLDQTEAGIPVIVKYSPQDFGSSASAAATEAELLKVAATAFLGVRKQQLLPGRFLPEGRALDARVTSAERDVQAIFVPPASAKLQQASQQSNDWIFSITGIRRVDVVGIYVEPIQKQLDLQKQNDLATAKSLDKKRLQIEKRLRDKYLARLSSQPGQFVKTDDVQKDENKLAQANEVVKAKGDFITADQARADSTLLAKAQEAGDSQPSIADTYLIFDIQRRPQIATLLLSIAGGYSPEDKFTARGSLTGENLLSSFIPADQSISINYAGGNEVQKGEFHFSIHPQPSKNPEAHWAFGGFSIDGTFSRDNDQRLGNETGPEFKDREADARASGTFSFDSFSTRDHILRSQALDKKRKRTRYGVDFNPVFRYRDVDIKTRETTSQEIARGRVTTASLSVNQQVSHDSMGSPGGGIGWWDISLNLRGETSLDVLGADFHYRQFLATITGELFFGFANKRDLLFRYQRGLGLSTRNTPVFQLFRLGGNLNVRGLEEGEFVGINLGFERYELGKSLRFISKLLGADKGQPGAGGGTIGGIDLANTYIKAFYDRGLVTDLRAIGDLLAMKHAVKGYGLAVELRGLSIGKRRGNLTLGYAKSPDSRLHRNGVVVTGISMDL